MLVEQIIHLATQLSFVQWYIIFSL